MIMNTVRRPPGLGSAGDEAGGAGGVVFAADSRLTSGSIVVAIESLFDPSVDRDELVKGSGDAGRPCQGDARGRGREARVDVRVARPNQVRLRVDHLDIARHARLEALARLRPAPARPVNPAGW